MSTIIATVNDAIFSAIYPAVQSALCTAKCTTDMSTQYKPVVETDDTTVNDAVYAAFFATVSPAHNTTVWAAVEYPYQYSHYEHHQPKGAVPYLRIFSSLPDYFHCESV